MSSLHRVVAPTVALHFVLCYGGQALIGCLSALTFLTFGA